MKQFDSKKRFGVLLVISLIFSGLSTSNLKANTFAKAEMCAGAAAVAAAVGCAGGMKILNSVGLLDPSGITQEYYTDHCYTAYFIGMYLTLAGAYTLASRA